jgi:hypothetical protein
MRIGHPAVSQGSKAYILRSTLDPVLIERATLTNKRILEVEAAEVPDDVDGAEPDMRTYGSLIAWNSADQLPTLGTISDPNIGPPPSFGLSRSVTRVF